MSGTPTAERPPQGLDAYWLGVWRHALKTLKAQGTWCWEQKPLLDEYVLALRESQRALEVGEDTRWDRHCKRARLLAQDLVLTVEARRRHGIGGDEEPAADPFAAFDELAERRRRAG